MGRHSASREYHQTRASTLDAATGVTCRRVPARVPEAAPAIDEPEVRPIPIPSAPLQIFAGWLEVRPEFAMGVFEHDPGHVLGFLRRIGVPLVEVGQADREEWRRVQVPESVRRLVGGLMQGWVEGFEQEIQRWAGGGDERG